MGYNWIGNAGHGPKSGGGFDPGAVGPTGLREADVTKKVEAYWAQYMRANGANVVWEVQDGDLADIYNGANAVGARTPGDEMFVSFHDNSAVDPSAHGCEVYALQAGGKGEQLAKLIDAELRGSGLTDRGVKFANYAVLRETDMSAVLVELAFISNPTEEALLKKDDWLKARAKEIATACLKFEGKSLTVDPFAVAPEQYMIKVNNNPVTGWMGVDAVVKTYNEQVKPNAKPGDHLVIVRKSDGVFTTDYTVPTPPPAPPAPADQTLQDKINQLTKDLATANASNQDLQRQLQDMARAFKQQSENMAQMAEDLKKANDELMQYAGVLKELKAFALTLDKVKLMPIN